MFIKLRWTNLNVVPVVSEIYRSETPFERDDLPSTPIATLADGEVEYTDTDNIEYGKSYYYAIKTTGDNGSVVSAVYEAVAQPSTGPGPQRLVAGDTEAGFYGIVPLNDFITPHMLNATPLSQCTAWFKFAWQGKVLFMPNGAVRNLSYNAIYAHGRVFGTGDAGNHPELTGVNQNSSIVINNREYVIRLPRGGVGDNWSISDVDPESEIAQLLFRVANYVPVQQLTENWLNCSYANTTGQSRPGRVINPSGYPILLQEVPLNNPELAARLSDNYQLSTVGRSTRAGWWPVLESTPNVLIEVD